VIRKAGADDVTAVARLFRTVRRACLPYLPELHTPDEDLAFFCDRVFAECEVWLAQADALDGFIAFRSGWVEHLYVNPERHRQGLGKALLARAMQTHAPLRLWVFKRNTGAIRFYCAHGFREIRGNRRQLQRGTRARRADGMDAQLASDPDIRTPVRRALLRM